MCRCGCVGEDLQELVGGDLNEAVDLVDGGSVVGERSIVEHEEEVHHFSIPAFAVVVGQEPGSQFDQRFRLDWDPQFFFVLPQPVEGCFA